MRRSVSLILIGILLFGTFSISYADPTTRLEKKLARKLDKLNILLVEGELCKETLADYKDLSARQKKYIIKLEDKVLKRTFYEKQVTVVIFRIKRDKDKSRPGNVTPFLICENSLYVNY